jgi:hypothetical protein
MEKLAFEKERLKRLLEIEKFRAELERYLFINHKFYSQDKNKKI